MVEVNFTNFERIEKYLWKLPKESFKEMKVPVLVYASEAILKDSLKDNSLKQLINIASINSLYKYVLAMPDIHEGYGFPIGGVAAIEAKTGGILPGGVGFDINCGVRLLKTPYKKEHILNFQKPLLRELFKQIPSGLGKGRKLKFNIKEIDNVLNSGLDYIIKKGYGSLEDKEFVEDKGSIFPADSTKVSSLAKQRGSDQLGTLGSGNHFLEVQEVEKIFDKEIAKIFGLFEGQTTIMIHTGSRGLGHQVATDYLKKFLSKSKKKLIDKELVSMPFVSEDGQDYFKAMNAAANFAFTNRQLITHFVRISFQNVFKTKFEEIKIVYDVAHNIAKLEDGLLVHRKGATRAFPPNHWGLPEKYKKSGQPVLVPGTMGTSSYVLVGSPLAQKSFYSVCHGAGRVMSRKKALKMTSGKATFDNLDKKGIIVETDSLKSLAEEFPGAYKDIDEVVKVVVGAGLANLVAKLKPFGVIKG